MCFDIIIILKQIKMKHFLHRVFMESPQSVLTFNKGPYGIMLEMYQWITFCSYFFQTPDLDIFFLCSTYESYC